MPGSVMHQESGRDCLSAESVPLPRLAGTTTSSCSASDYSALLPRARPDQANMARRMLTCLGQCLAAAYHGTSTPSNAQNRPCNGRPLSSTSTMPDVASSTLTLPWPPVMSVRTCARGGGGEGGQCTFLLRRIHCKPAAAYLQTRCDDPDSTLNQQLSCCWVVTKLGLVCGIYGSS
jgi:hypothetical protein